MTYILFVFFRGECFRIRIPEYCFRRVAASCCFSFISSFIVLNFNNKKLMKSFRYHLACNLNLDLYHTCNDSDRQMSKGETEEWYTNKLQKEEEKKDRLMMIKNYQNFEKNSNLTFTPNINSKYRKKRKYVSI